MFFILSLQLILVLNMIKLFFLCILLFCNYTHQYFYTDTLPNVSVGCFMAVQVGGSSKFNQGYIIKIPPLICSLVFLQHTLLSPINPHIKSSWSKYSCYIIILSKSLRFISSLLTIV